MLERISKSYWSIYACKDNESYRLEEAAKDIVRTDFFRDIDRIIYSLSYMRYIDKTQVFSNIDNDHLSKRIIHVQLVSKIARTIGRSLGLNEDLIEAASLGHDLGHVPFGHTGEAILNEISLKYNQGYFNHNIQSVRVLKEIENGGKGSNISVQVLDAIMCHNGEVLEKIYYPKKKTKEEFLTEYYNCYNDKEILKNLKPMTLEGCLVRICDIISYIGRDFEEAVRIGLIKDKDIPDTVSNVLGNTNSQIINTIILDIINNSLDKPYIAMSDNVNKAIKELMDFNYKNIYYKVNSNDQINNYKEMFNSLFEIYLSHIKMNKTNEDIYVVFLNDMSLEYLTNNSDERKVIDYIAGMTDDYFMAQYEKYM